MAGILSPLVTLLGAYHHAVPMLVYGITPLVAAGFCLLLPETLNVELQDHAEVRSAVDPVSYCVKLELKRDLFKCFSPLAENLKMGPRGTKFPSCDHWGAGGWFSNLKPDLQRRRRWDCAINLFFDSLNV